MSICLVFRRAIVHAASYSAAMILMPAQPCYADFFSPLRRRHYALADMLPCATYFRTPIALRLQRRHAFAMLP